MGTQHIRCVLRPLMNCFNNNNNNQRIILTESNPPAAVCTDSWPSDTLGTGNQGYWANWETEVKIPPLDNVADRKLLE